MANTIRDLYKKFSKSTSLDIVEVNKLFNDIDDILSKHRKSNELPVPDELEAMNQIIDKFTNLYIPFEVKLKEQYGQEYTDESVSTLEVLVRHYWKAEEPSLFVAYADSLKLKDTLGNYIQALWDLKDHNLVSFYRKIMVSCDYKVNPDRFQDSLRFLYNIPFEDWKEKNPKKVAEEVLAFIKIAPENIKFHNRIDLRTQKKGELSPKQTIALIYQKYIEFKLDNKLNPEDNKELRDMNAVLKQRLKEEEKKINVKKHSEFIQENYGNPSGRKAIDNKPGFLKRVFGRN